MIPSLFNTGLFSKPPTGGTVGGWKELGRTTLGSTADSIDVSSLADKRYLMCLNDFKPSGATQNFQRFNNDSGSNYAYRLSDNGGADATGVSQANNYWYGYGTSGIPEFTVAYIANLSANEKQSIQSTIQQNTAGAGTAPQRREGVNKWANTTSVIDQITMINTGAGDFNTGSELVILGWDEADTHTDNFWEELASVTSVSSGANIDSGVFTAKKYLWVQAWFQGTGGTVAPWLRLGNTTVDSATNYAWRHSGDGGVDSTGTTASSCPMAAAADDDPIFVNMFIINNSSNEKLVYGHTINQNTAGAANAPRRSEFAAKWDNTAAQCDIVGFFDNGGTGNFATDCQIKVWGSD